MYPYPGGSDGNASVYNAGGGTRVWSLGWEDPLEKEMAIHSSTVAWKTPGTEEPGRLQSTGLQSWTRLSDFTFIFFTFSFKSWNPVWLLNYLYICYVEAWGWHRVREFFERAYGEWFLSNFLANCACYHSQYYDTFPPIRTSEHLNCNMWSFR